ncbi:ImmA/IrrE family metallo-endopeptidase [Mucilaginibacter conchicola]|uniref:ImmA/IrrE family metallo-endopeptidase n=1 Tax=Mucilaginibacter conchicola TaxID=2303333 RepID=A0A372NUJ6_9SPHI|nr:ImmA/IrrE family metallo-endopeptidase [Mucilaginibacter conchicola]RFZ92943.1 ImmA/IrrE family metallo-endopeptidase [Mucilaginibacter conchicola]
MSTRTHARSIHFIKKRADAILSELNIRSLPVKIEDVAKALGLRVTPFAFDDDISGVLVIENEQGYIGYNQNESRVRRRFTIAHECGHYALHSTESKMFMDKGFNAIFRSRQSGLTEETQVLEREANTFAAYILMPDHLLKKEIDQIDFDLGSEDDIKNLAKVFDVSSQAMYYRILNSGLLRF